jgi:hypothetical protein
MSEEVVQPKPVRRASIGPATLQVPIHIVENDVTVDVKPVQETIPFTLEALTKLYHQVTDTRANLQGQLDALPAQIN